MGTFRFWSERDGCDRHFIIETTDAYVDHIAIDCADGTVTRLLAVHAHPHAWPGGHKTWLFSPTPNPNLDASLVIAEFLTSSRVRLNRPPAKPSTDQHGSPAGPERDSPTPQQPPGAR